MAGTAPQGGIQSFVLLGHQGLTLGVVVKQTQI